jgi:hypothetical protein
MEAIEERERANTRVLHRVFGIGRASRQPSRQIVGGVQMRKHGVLETLLPARFPHFPP